MVGYVGGINAPDVHRMHALCNSSPMHRMHALCTPTPMHRMHALCTPTHQPAKRYADCTTRWWWGGRRLALLCADEHQLCHKHRRDHHHTCNHHLQRRRHSSFSFAWSGTSATMRGMSAKCAQCIDPNRGVYGALGGGLPQRTMPNTSLCIPTESAPTLMQLW